MCRSSAYITRGLSSLLLSFVVAGCVADIPSGSKDGEGTDTPGTGSPTSEKCDETALVPTRVRKITDEQYAKLVVELLPNVTPGTVATPGTESALIRDAEEFIVRGPLAGQYWDAAASAAEQAVENIENLVPCSPIPTDAAAQSTCAGEFIAAFGQKAFRRPVAADETTALLALFDEGAKTSFEKGIELVLTGVLQSADFLYRTELGDGTGTGTEVALTPYEVASVLSFIFTNTSPDAALLAAAESGALGTEAGVSEQVTRLMTLPAVQEHVTGLVARVLGTDKALIAVRDPQLFPELDAPLRQAMHDESSTFVSENIWGKQSLAELFTSRKAVLTDQLAAFYGVPAGTTELPAEQRAGILTRGATLLSLPTGSRAVHRGLFIAENYLCRTLTLPPAAVLKEIEETLALGLNEREVSNLRASKPECAMCHAHFDSLGLAFEGYDLIGRYLTERDGAPVDASGELTDTDVDGTFKDVLEMSQLFAQSNDVATCLSQKLTSQALGRKLASREICSVRQVIDPWMSTDKQLNALIPLLTESHFFLTRSRTE